MTFREDKVSEFLKIFNDSKDKIRQFPGCLHLELWKDFKKPNVYLTCSRWVNDEALQEYRSSGLFNRVWSQTKILFLDTPYAFSSKVVDTVN